MTESREKLYILCGLAGKGEDDIRNALTEKAEEAGYEAVCVSRYRKAGIRQYIAEHPEFRIVLLQESMQSSYPYTAEELAELLHLSDAQLNHILTSKPGSGLISVNNNIITFEDEADKKSELYKMANTKFDELHG